MPIGVNLVIFHIRKILKLTHKVRLGNRTIGVNLVVSRVRESLFSPVGTQCL